jgi:urea transport system permease protein
MPLLHKLGIEKTTGIFLLLFLATFPLYGSDFRVELMGKFIVFIIFAIALDLIWGYTGLLSLGHAVFFGLGGYILALSYTFQNGVPMFMKRFGIEEIPGFYKPLLNIPIAFLLGLIIPALVAGIIGYFIFKSKVSGVYFAIITLALAKLMSMLFINLQAYTGGSNGLMGLPRFPIFGEPLSLVTYYYLLLVIAIGVYLFTRWLMNSHFGKVIKAIRENEGRTSFLSYNPANFKIFIFVISGFLSGLAGMLYVPINGFISPEELGVGLSTFLVLWLAIGGRGTLMGAAIGVIIINWLQTLLSESFPEMWQLFVGLVMVLIVMYLPDGIYGTVQKKWNEYSVMNSGSITSKIKIFTQRNSQNTSKKAVGK